MVDLINTSWKNLEEILLQKKIVCYGAGEKFKEFMELVEDQNVNFIIEACIDRNADILNKEKDDAKYITFEKFIASDITFDCIIITNSKNCLEIFNLIDREPRFDEKYCLFFDLIEIDDREENNTEQCNLTDSTINNIPKIIHYCWFGGNEMPQEYIDYMESWKRFCPEYKIMRWDENNYDITKNKYMYDAYKEKKWAFVSDYARLDVLYNYGGIYLDTDVELLRPLDNLLSYDFVSGFESYKYVNTGLLAGAKKGCSLIEDTIDLYDKLSFYNDDGSLNMTPCVVYQAKILSKHGFKMNGRTQLMNNMKIFPRTYFSPYCLHLQGEKLIKENSYSIHHYGASWNYKYKKEQQDSMEIINKRMRYI